MFKNFLLAQNGSFPPILRCKNAHYALHNSAFCASTGRKCAHFGYNPKFKHPLKSSVVMAASCPFFASGAKNWFQLAKNGLPF
jgi:hypothetical protein